MEIDFCKIRSHVLKAEMKHPEFCDAMTSGGWDVALRKLRVLNGDKAPVFYADNIAAEELAEIFEAYEKGEKAHAIEECYDLIAVALRIIERIMNESDTNSSESGN